MGIDNQKFSFTNPLFAHEKDAGGTLRSGSAVSQEFGGDVNTWGNPYAWAGHATVEDLKGLRTYIIVNELDILRDEGVNFYRRLGAAGVRVQCRMVLGTPHAGDLDVGVAPDLAYESFHSLAEFAKKPRDTM